MNTKKKIERKEIVYFFTFTLLIKSIVILFICLKDKYKNLEISRKAPFYFAQRYIFG